MKRLTICLLALLPALSFGQRNRDWPSSWRVDDTEKIDRSFTFSGGDARRLLVDNVSGFVHVSGSSGATAQVSVARRIRAVSDSAVQEAKRDVKLDMDQQGNSVRLYVDGPFRSRYGVNYRGDEYYGYRVIYDFEIQVPPDTELVLKTVNDGDIVVKKTTGEFSVSGVNGGIEMQEITGAGTVRTVNGPVKVSFTRNPSKACEFRSVNGNLDVYFQPSLNADLSFHTLNGGVYTDFDVTARPAAGKGESVDGKFLYRVDRRNMNARTGSGGPEMKFDTVNGAIRLRSKGI
jgi:hypothetical protein